MVIRKKMAISPSRQSCQHLKQLETSLVTTNCLDLLSNSPGRLKGDLCWSRLVTLARLVIKCFRINWVNNRAHLDSQRRVKLTNKD